MLRMSDRQCPAHGQKQQQKQQQQKQQQKQQQQQQRPGRWLRECKVLRAPALFDAGASRRSTVGEHGSIVAPDKRDVAGGRQLRGGVRGSVCRCCQDSRTPGLQDS